MKPSITKQRAVRTLVDTYGVRVLKARSAFGHNSHQFAKALAAFELARLRLPER